MAIQDISYFDNTKTGELLSRLSSDTQILQSGVTVNVSMLVRSIVTALGAVLFLFSISWKLTMVMFSSVPIVVLGAVLYGNHVSEQQDKFQDKLAAASAQAQEYLSQIRTVKSFAKEEHSIQLYSKTIEETHAVGVRIAGLQAVFTGFVMFFPQAAIALVLYAGGILVMRSELTGGELTSFLLYTFTLAMSIGTISSLWGDAMQVNLSSN